jgi:hypothetical protein
MAKKREVFRPKPEQIENWRPMTEEELAAESAITPEDIERAAGKLDAFLSEHDPDLKGILDAEVKDD